jgi:hypothetical protein
MNTIIVEKEISVEPTAIRAQVEDRAILEPVSKPLYVVILSHASGEESRF